MKREEVKNKISGITDEQLDWIMGEYGAGINAEKQKTAELQSQFDGVNAQLATAKESLKGFEGINADDLKNQITDLQKKLSEQAAAFAFDSLLDGAIRDNGGRNIKAVRSMIDVESLRKSEKQAEDIKTALDKCKTDNSWAFADSTQHASASQEHGQQGNNAHEMDGVEAAFLKLNPNLKVD